MKKAYDEVTDATLCLNSTNARLRDTAEKFVERLNRYLARFALRHNIPPLKFDIYWNHLQGPRVYLPHTKNIIYMTVQQVMDLFKITDEELNDVGGEDGGSVQ